MHLLGGDRAQVLAADSKRAARVPPRRRRLMATVLAWDPLPRLLGEAYGHSLLQAVEPAGEDTLPVEEELAAMP